MQSNVSGMHPVLEGALAIRAALTDRGLSIYESLVESPGLVYSPAEIEALLTHELVGRTFDAPIRRRAKLAKQAIAEALGYPVPATMQQTKPRFPGQDLDVFVQQSNNLQVWNDEVSPTRRYAILSLDAGCTVRTVRVIESTVLSTYDKTGTLTSKYQASRRAGRAGSKLVSAADTGPFQQELAPVADLGPELLNRMVPTSQPRCGQVLTVASLHERLLDLVGSELPHLASERQRGEQLHRAACRALGLGSYADTGRFPDIVCQALEVKLQLARTIDLGLISPDSTEPALTLSPRLRHCDARYAVVYAVRADDNMRIEHVVTATGADFFSEFQRFGGLGQNHKLQLRLPREFFPFK